MTTEQQTIAVDAAALAELRRAYRTLREAQAAYQAAEQASRTPPPRGRSWAGWLSAVAEAARALPLAATAFQRAAEAFVAGLEEEH